MVYNAQLMPIQTYQEALDWLYGFVRFDENRKHIAGGGDLSRMARLLDRMGAPHTRYPSIIIAGTKGKGSTAAMLASMLRASGYRTGLYTSPHLHTFRERIRVDDELITRPQIIAGAQRLEKLTPEFPDAIWFELVTALAFEYFAQQQVNVAVLEVGLGGRLDATNVVSPRVAVITSISYDHIEVLGATLPAIAREKAGIIKPVTPVVSAPQAPEALAVIEAVALEKGAPLILVGRDWRWESISAGVDGQRFQVEPVLTGAGKGPESEAYVFEMPLAGPHQLFNATTALATAFELRRQGWRLGDAEMKRGMATVQWPARFEVLDRAPLTVADGAHNRASARELANALVTLLPGRRVHLIFGASSDKDIAGMFAELLPHAATLILTHSHHLRAAAPGRLAELAALFHIPVLQTENVAQALAAARQQVIGNEVIGITGSLFVAAEARALILAERGTPVETDED
ncbi:MAG: folylpolyglutamate synthase/dihydrofolate synthase family protein [Anaerolineae bacterium]